MNRSSTTCVLALCALGFVFSSASAQYFGRNKVQYENFDFKVLHTEHFDIHYYPEAELAVRDAARMAERWYTRLSRVFNHQFRERKPIVLYANQGDFQQTNTISSMIGEGTGGVTEALKNRVILPFTGSYADFDHVLGHELVHAFQYDIAGEPKGPGLESLGKVPLWAIEGLAEYLSVGRDDPHTTMWLRDALLRDDLPTLRQVSTDFRYFPYRYGQAIWAYIAGRYGDQKVNELFRSALRVGLDQSIRRVLGVSDSTLSAEWIASVRERYAPLIAGRTKPAEIGRRILGGDASDLNISPMVSPNGRYIAFFSQRGLFSIDLFVADVQTGEVVRKLASAGNGPHSDALRFLSSSGAWSPDGRYFAYIVFAEGNDEVAILDIAARDVTESFQLENVGAISALTWSPDGTSIALSGTAGGISDLYTVDVRSKAVRRLTSDRYADLQPSYSPDGRTIVFATDRGPATNFAALSYDQIGLATIDVASGVVTPLELFTDARHINPQFSGDGRDVYFVSDHGGFTDIYRHRLGTSEIYRVTQLASGVSGVTALSPSISVAQRDGSVYFSVFEDNGYRIHALSADAAQGTLVTTRTDDGALAGVLPPGGALDTGMVASYLVDPATGLPPVTTYVVTDYSPSLQLDYIGTPTIGVSVDSYGAGVGGGIAAYFSDMLGNHQVGAALNMQGSIQDISLQASYINRSNRWNWGVAGGHLPYASTYTTTQPFDTSIGGAAVQAYRLEQVTERTFVDAVQALAIYPFSTTHRFEAGVGYTHVGYSVDVDQLTVVGDRAVAEAGFEAPTPDGLHFVRPNAAYVGDYSFFGYTSPVAGARYRLELGGTFGSLTFGTILADYRQYLFANPITFAVRGMAYGRFGPDSESDRVSPLYVGRESFIRGYSAYDFTPDECTDYQETGRCPEVERLIGSRIAVANAEIRVPVFGTEDLGLIEFPMLPLEISAFADAGLAWSAGESVDLRFDRTTSDRVPVFSAGLSARVNLFGILVAEVFYVYPFQRPERGWHFGWQIAPGW